jgi:molybdopterin converting factor subunit 1
MSSSTAVEVLLFARLREQAGGDRFEIEVPEGATVADVYERLRELKPRLEPNRNLIRVALNEAFAAWDDTVARRDVVAFIPPVSGGLGGGVAPLALVGDVEHAEAEGDAAQPEGAGEGDPAQR